MGNKRRIAVASLGLIAIVCVSVGVFAFGHGVWFGLGVITKIIDVSENEIYGRYVLNLDKGKEELFLHNDRTYSQRIDLGDGRHFINDGQWSFKVEGDFFNRYNLVLENPIIAVNGFGEIEDNLEPRGTTAIYNIYSYFGRLEMPVNEDAGLYYKKAD